MTAAATLESSWAMTLPRRGWWPSVNSFMVRARIQSTFSSFKQQVAPAFPIFGPIIKIKKCVCACVHRSAGVCGGKRVNFTYSSGATNKGLSLAWSFWTGLGCLASSTRGILLSRPLALELYNY